MITWYMLVKEGTMLHLRRPETATTANARAGGTGENGGLPLQGD